MKRFSEQLHKKASTVKLKKSEQAELRDRLVSYMEYHPLPAELQKVAAAPKKKLSSERQPLSTDSFAIYRIPFANLFKIGGALAALVLVVVPFVAEHAVPGDTLYAVKVNFNEEIRSTLTLDPYQKVEWETVRLNRRIAEARLLAEEGKLTKETEAEVAAAVKEHTNNAKAEIAALRASDADDAAIAEIALDSTLSVQAQTFARAQARLATSSPSQTDLIADAIDASLLKPETATTTLPSLPKLTARVEQITTRIHELDATLTTDITAVEQAEITRRIEDIERVAGEALSLPTEAELEAKQLMVDVLMRAQKLIVFMTDLAVRNTVTIEDVVPRVLTTDEKNVYRATQLRELDSYISKLSDAEPEDAAVAEKVDALLAQLETFKDELADVTDHTVFVKKSATALQLGRDALLLLEQVGVTITLPTDRASSTDMTASSSATSTTPNVVPTASSTASSTAAVGAASSTASSTASLDEIADRSSTSVDALLDLDVEL